MVSQFKISVIITFSKKQIRNDIKELYFIYKNRIELTTQSFEFIFVTDDNSDDVLGALKQLQMNGEKIKVVKLARWFGDAAALNIGFEESSGQLILTLPASHQINPNEISEIINSFNSDMVIANRRRYKDNFSQRIQAKFFHFLVKLFFGEHYHDLGCRVRIFKREVLEYIHVYGDQIRFLPLLANRFGFKVSEYNVEQYQSGGRKRIYSPGHYTERLVDLISIFFLIKFTKKPLRFFGFPGTIIFAIGALSALFLFYQRVFLNISLANKPIVLVSILLIVFGIQLFAIGLVAEIIIFTHSKDSKEYIVEQVINGKKEVTEKVHQPEIEEEV